MLKWIRIVFGTIEGILVAESYYVPYNSFFDHATYEGNKAYTNAKARQDAGKTCH